MTVLRKDLNENQVDELRANIRMEDPQAVLEVIPQPGGLFTLVIRSAIDPIASGPARDAPADSLTYKVTPSSTRLAHSEPKRRRSQLALKLHAMGSAQKRGYGAVTANLNHIINIIILHP